MPIKCRWIEKNTFVVNPDGQVLPCCYFANVVYNKTHKKGILEQYDQQKDQLNAFNQPITEILKSEWFTKTLPESWEDSATTPTVCRKWCNNATN